jgi:hypothetical protein
MTSRTWNDGAAPALSAANLNALEADLDRALLNRYATKTANYTMAAGDSVVIGNGSSITITLPDPTTVANNSSYVVKNIHSTILTVNSAGTSKTIDGAASVGLVQYGAMRVVSDGSVWRTAYGTYASPASVRATASAYGASGHPSVTVPASAVAGDLLLCFVGSNYGFSTAQGLPKMPATGWQPLGHTDAPYYNTAVFAKKCTSADIGATLSGVQLQSTLEGWHAWVVAVQGATQFGSGAVTQTHATGSAVTSVGTGVVTTTPNHQLLIFGAARVTAGGTMSSSLGTLVAYRASDTTQASGIWLASNPGALPSASITCSATTTGIASAVVSLY